MKINVLMVAFSFLCLSLSAQVDKVQVTKQFFEGWSADTEKQEALIKKYFSTNIKVTNPNGNIWPDGSDGSFDQFLNFYTSAKERAHHTVENSMVRELGNETYAFGVWVATILKDEKNPEWVGATAKVPVAYRLEWENDKVVHFQVYCDMGARTQQFEAASKEK